MYVLDIFLWNKFIKQLRCLLIEVFEEIKKIKIKKTQVRLSAENEQNFLWYCKSGNSQQLFCTISFTVMLFA